MTNNFFIPLKFKRTEEGVFLKVEKIRLGLIISKKKQLKELKQKREK